MDELNGIPYLAIGNDELKDNDVIGDSIICYVCGQEHEIRYGDEVKEIDGKEVRTKSTLLAIYDCGGKTYLAGIAGKDIRSRLKPRSE